MTHWRARIGLIYPGDGLIDWEFWKLAPDGVSIYITRTYSPPGEFTKFPKENEKKREDAIRLASKTLAVSRPHVIAYGSTYGSSSRGKRGDNDLAKLISEAAGGIPATTTGTATLEALKTLKIKKLAVLAPYPEDYTHRVKVYFEEQGLDVVNIKWMSLTTGWDIANTPLSEVYRLARKTDVKQAQGLFIACTNLPAVDILEPLEKDLKKPVVSANQATMWRTLRMSGVNSKIRGFGRLLEEH